MGYTEAGPLGVGLVFPSKTFERGTFNLGAAAGIDIAAGNGWIVRPEVRAAWSHYLTDPNPDVLAFAGGTIPVVLREIPIPAGTAPSSVSKSPASRAGFRSSQAMPASSARTRPPTRAALRVTW